MGARGPVRRPNRRVGALLLLVLQCLFAVDPAQSAEGKDLLRELEVAYIYNFTRFVQWPKAADGRSFCIGVIGDPAMEARLRELEQDGKRVDDRRIEIRAYATPGAIAPCEILFVGAGAEHQLAAIVRRTAGEPTLLVGDTPGFAGRGVAIELFRKPDIFRKTDRLRIRIDPAALEGRDLKVSAQLYDVAEVLR